jgi:Tfp pilus assembly protein FimT
LKKLVIVVVIVAILAVAGYAFTQWRAGQQASALDN